MSKSIGTCLAMVCGTVVLACAVTANAAVINYGASLSGANENPPVVSPGTGSVTVTVDTGLNTMRVQATFSNLVGNTTAAHIHCCTVAPNNVGVATQTPSFVGFPLSVTSGTFDNTLDMLLASSWNPTYVTNNGGTVATAWSALMAGLGNGQAYFNIHTSFRAGGEIRGFLNQVPEPGTLALLGLGLFGLGVSRRHKL